MLRSSVSRISKALHLDAFARLNDAPVLSCADVLEQEYAALHSDGSVPTTSTVQSPPGFTADDIADVMGLARALLDAAARSGVGEGTLRKPWAPRPPAPPTSPMTAMGTKILATDPELPAALQATLVEHADGNPVRDDDPIRRRLTHALNALLPDDLESARAERPAIESTFGPLLRSTEERRLADIRRRIHAEGHTALCLSGGGIRSASFAMGVVQGLARRGLLSRFDYLSTVSGGGYTGSWLSAWMAREGASRVHSQLADPATDTANCEPAPLRHIRAFSYYLNPSFGLFSADTWTLIATIARNILLVWLVVLPPVAAALMLPSFLVSIAEIQLTDWKRFHLDPGDFVFLVSGVGFIAATYAIGFVLRRLYSYTGRNDGDTSVRDPVTLQQFMKHCLLPLMVAMIVLAQAWEMTWMFIDHQAVAPGEVFSRYALVNAVIAHAPPPNVRSLAVQMGIEFWVPVYFLAWLWSARGRRYRPMAGFFSAVCGALAGAIGGLASAAVFGSTPSVHSHLFVTFAVPLSLGGLLVSKQVIVGLASRQMTDAERESNARFSAWLLIAIVSWIGVVGIALYGPDLLGKLTTAGWRALAGATTVTGIIGSLLGASSKAPTTKSSARPGGLGGAVRRVAIGLVTPFFAVTALVLVAGADQVIIKSVHTPPGWLNLSSGTAAPLTVLLLCLSIALAGYALALQIDTNRFSLHAMYRLRLVRTFLGASKPPGERQPNPFTGFDETDDMPMADLWPALRRSDRDATRADGPRPPIHILNLTLNNVAGSSLATQNRKATSFTVSPLHAGCADIGYRQTSDPASKRARLYGGQTGISLGTAMAISGAAASPNAGYHSSPSVTLLMTLFNARLGWWLGNPGPAGQKTFDFDEPKLALLPILQEMFGRTTDHSKYVYLSDGGHFENLGVYEMVRRRCRTIVVSDAGEDAAGTFEDLGGAIRKIRIDFGIPIDFDSSFPIYPRDISPPPGDARYWTVGRIGYSEVDPGARDGILLYIKPAFYETEPRDVYNYGKGRPDFPHESTGNQFFGEAQFESYRKLGELVVDQICGSDFNPSAGLDELITRARRLDPLRPTESRTTAPDYRPPGIANATTAARDVI
ncbi:MAG TPA: patatin-like phospholipase family protein [Gemmatimonadaceae bacterium]|nr:patatin-like phospholipase family protein [Gemmatimonadaceae bacterium]